MDPKFERMVEKHHWFNFQQFYDWVAKQCLEGWNSFVEVGVWRGHSIIHLAKALNKNGCVDPKIYAVDCFDKVEDPIILSKLEEGEQEILWEIYDYNLTINDVRNMITDIRMPSPKAADEFEDDSLDFVFIDANHDYEPVKADIAAWKPKIRKGGVLAGHDYKNGWKGVDYAVKESLGSGNFEVFPGSVWMHWIEK